MQSDSTNSNPIANDAVAATKAYGFTGVAARHAAYVNPILDVLER